MQFAFETRSYVFTSRKSTSVETYKEKSRSLFYESAPVKNYVIG